MSGDFLTESFLKILGRDKGLLPLTGLGDNKDINFFGAPSGDVIGL